MATTAVKLPEEVVTHPLVLLSIVDHYNRVAKDTSKRVVGVLLGSTFHGKCDITNSFAVPFDEDLRNPGIWYLDHDFLESMYQMFKKINGTWAGCSLVCLTDCLTHSRLLQPSQGAHRGLLQLRPQDPQGRPGH